MELRGMKRAWIVIAIVSLWLSGCEKTKLDEEVRRLCAQDGGLKIYETVKTPSEKFDKWGMVTFYDPTKGENTLGAEYLFKRDIHYYRQGNPQMSRWHTQIFRRSDGKLLGETVFYSRGGGDMPGPWHESSFACPNPSETGEVVLIQRVFVKSN